MHEVVYNNCYGGFGLSDDAIQWLEQNAKDLELKDYISKIKITCTRDAEIAYFIKEEIREPKTGLYRGRLVYEYIYNINE